VREGGGRERESEKDRERERERAPAEQEAKVDHGAEGGSEEGSYLRLIHVCITEL